MLQAKHKELQIRGEYTDRPKLITNDNAGIIQSRECLADISRLLSDWTQQDPLSMDMIRSLFTFLKEQVPATYLTKSYKWSINELARRFYNQVIMPSQNRSDSIIGEEPLYNDYFQNEIKNTTHNENGYKFSAHQDRIGRPANISNYLDGDSKKTYSFEDVIAHIGELLDSNDIESISKKISSYNINFNNITLPRTRILFDSRYCLSNIYDNVLSWNIHTSGNEGFIGDIRTRDTLVEAIAVSVCPFWLPIVNPKDVYYDQIVMSIKEFKNQSVHHTEFLGPTETDIYVNDYHFRFDVKDIQKNKMLLVPCETFKFRKPQSRIETITIEFKSPFQNITLPSTKGTFTITAGNPTLFTGPVHNLATGDLIYVLNYVSLSRTINDLVNNMSGHFIQRIDATRFTIAIDTTAYPSTPVVVVYGSKRIFFELEFISLEQ